MPIFNQIRINQPLLAKVLTIKNEKIDINVNPDINHGKHINDFKEWVSFIKTSLAKRKASISIDVVNVQKI